MTAKQLYNLESLFLTVNIFHPIRFNSHQKDQIERYIFDTKSSVPYLLILALATVYIEALSKLNEN